MTAFQLAEAMFVQADKLGTCPRGYPMITLSGRKVIGGHIDTLTHFADYGWAQLYPSCYINGKQLRGHSLLSPNVQLHAGPFAPCLYLFRDFVFMPFEKKNVCCSIMCISQSNCEWLWHKDAVHNAAQTRSSIPAGICVTDVVALRHVDQLLVTPVDTPRHYQFLTKRWQKSRLGMHDLLRRFF